MRSTLLVVVVLLAAGSLRYNLGPSSVSPAALDWSEAAESIREGWRPGDAVRVEPFWLRGSAGLLLDRLREGERTVPFDRSVPNDPMFNAKYERLWVLSAFGVSERRGLPFQAVLEGSQELEGGLVLQRYRLPPSPIRVDLLSRLKEAVVERWVGDEEPRTCEWRQDHHNCGANSWENVLVAVKEVARSPRRCVLLHPYPDRGTVRLTFPDVRLGHSLLVRSGFTLDAARNQNGSETTLRIRINGVEVARRVEPPNDWTWTSTTVNTVAQRGETVEVALEVTAVEEDFRDLCVDAYVLSSSPPQR